MKECKTAWCRHLAYWDSTVLFLCFFDYKFCGAGVASSPPSLGQVNVLVFRVMLSPIWRAANPPAWLRDLDSSIARCQKISVISHALAEHQILCIPWFDLITNAAAHGVLACVVAQHTERHTPNGWRRPPGRPCRTWVQQIGNSSISSLLYEWNLAIGHGHVEISATSHFCLGDLMDGWKGSQHVS